MKPKQKIEIKANTLSKWNYVPFWGNMRFHWCERLKCSKWHGIDEVKDTMNAATITFCVGVFFVGLYGEYFERDRCRFCLFLLCRSNAWVLIGCCHEYGGKLASPIFSDARHLLLRREHNEAYAHKRTSGQQRILEFSVWFTASQRNRRQSYSNKH